VGPADDLLEPAQLRLDLDRDDLPGDRIVEDKIDHAPDWSIDRHLHEPLPTWMELAEERLDNRRLDVIADVRTGSRVEADAQLAPKRRRYA